jgi:hypothetical protein
MTRWFIIRATVNPSVRASSLAFFRFIRVAAEATADTTMMAEAVAI